MLDIKSKMQVVVRSLGAAVMLSAVSGLAQASTPILKASQDMVVHSMDGIGCQDISNEPKGGNLRSGSCVEFQINIQNECNKNTASSINYNNPIKEDLIFVAAFAEGFTTGTLDIPTMNTDCGTDACFVMMQNASLKPQQTGTLKIRAIVK